MRHLRRAAKSLATALAVALAVLASTNCAPASAAAADQHPCCKSMAHHCGTSALRSGCCTVAPQADDAVATTWAAAAAYALTSPAAVPVLFTPPALVPIDGLVRAHAPKPPGVATYLLVSSFRI